VAQHQEERNAAKELLKANMQNDGEFGVIGEIVLWGANTVIGRVK
jgi:hypothetical protein